ncbi:unnamed protein product [Brassica napus]|uniref:(rape) hypothetical protein n=1 Tax=Brassica napus TaxID=3708 RepID=A0A816M4P4_BRANA|nr:unnamed protein product [Brassica napus]
MIRSKWREAENKSAKGKEETTSSRKRTKSAHEKLYMRNRAMKEEGKHRSYLPYKQGRRVRETYLKANVQGH